MQQLGSTVEGNLSSTNISDNISDKAHPLWRNMAIIRNQQWGHLPLTDEVFDIFEKVSKITQPKQILEIGFNKGFSCSIQLQVNPDATIHTYDPRVLSWWTDVPNRQPDRNVRDFFYREGTFVDLATLAFGERFHFYNTVSENTIINHSSNFFDYVFIDGHHDYPYVKTDIFNTIQLKIPYALIDNLNIPDVRRAVDECEQLELIEEMEYTQIYPNDGRKIPDKMGLYEVTL